MKKLTTLLLFSLLSNLIYSQSPEKWTYTQEKNKDGETTLVFTVTLEKDWHIYSQFTDDGGPLPMVFKFEDSPCYTRIEKVTEPEAHTEYDSLFMVTVRTFDKEVSFKQKVKINSANCEIKGKIEYQVCKEACLFKSTDFSFTIEEAKSK